MAMIHVCATRRVDVSAETVYGYLADLREHHPRFLPPAFSEFEVESGGVGHGTITRFKVAAGGRTREYRMRVAEPEPHRVRHEFKPGDDVYRHSSGRRLARGDLHHLKAAAGIGGFFERLFAPRVMRGIYTDELERLNSYARQRAASDFGS
jgi:hypothetical protein